MAHRSQLHQPPRPTARTPRRARKAAAIAEAQPDGEGAKSDSPPPLPRWPFEPPTGAVRYVALCAYDGGSFQGWMGSHKSISLALERRLSSLLRHPVQVVGSGRTDAGVHARCQLFHFDAVFAQGAEVLVSALSHGLPPRLHVYRLAVASSDGFHARTSCLGKRYVYRICTGPVAPWEEGHCWDREGGPLDVAAMRAAAAHLVGRHHFGAFSAPTDEEKSCADPRGPVRQIWRLDILEPQNGSTQAEGVVHCARQGADRTNAGGPGIGQRQLLSIVVEADRYLMRMARLIVGTLVEVCRLGPQARIIVLMCCDSYQAIFLLLALTNVRLPRTTLR